MSSEVLLKRIYFDIKVVEYFLSPEGNPTNDRTGVDHCARKVYQIIENSIKYYLMYYYDVTINNKIYRTNDISKLVLYINKIDSEFNTKYPDISIDLDKISYWEPDNIYSGSYISERSDVERYFKITKDIYNDIINNKNNQAYLYDKKLKGLQFAKKIQILRLEKKLYTRIKECENKLKQTIKDKPDFIFFIINKNEIEKITNKILSYRNNITLINSIKNDENKILNLAQNKIRIKYPILYRSKI